MHFAFHLGPLVHWIIRRVGHFTRRKNNTAEGIPFEQTGSAFKWQSIEDVAVVRAITAAIALQKQTQQLCKLPLQVDL